MLTSDTVVRINPEDIVRTGGNNATLLWLLLEAAAVRVPLGFLAAGEGLEISLADCDGAELAYFSSATNRWVMPPVSVGTELAIMTFFVTIKNPRGAIITVVLDCCEAA
jgi:hypothetical protein